MKKTILKNEAYYEITWAPFMKYDRHMLTRLMPIMPGLTGLYYKKNDRYTPTLFLECWRDGIRDGIKNFMDPFFLKYRELRKQVDMDEVYVSYTIINTSTKDLKDILYYLIQTYKPANNSDAFTHSGRYHDIHVSEIQSDSFDGLDKKKVYY